MKKVTTMVLACAMAASMTACGSAAAVTSSEASSTATAVSSEVSSMAIESVAASSEAAVSETPSTEAVSASEASSDDDAAIIAKMEEFAEFLKGYDSNATQHITGASKLEKTLNRLYVNMGATETMPTGLTSIAVDEFEDEEIAAAYASKNTENPTVVLGKCVLTVEALTAEYANEGDWYLTEDQKAEITAKFNELFAEFVE